MAKQRHIGFVIFGICSALSARIAMFEPKPHSSTATEERWGTRDREEGDALGLIHASRYYVYGLGILGLVLEPEVGAAVGWSVMLGLFFFRDLSLT